MWATIYKVEAKLMSKFKVLHNHELVPYLRGMRKKVLASHLFSILETF